ncbi:apoptosis inhibitor cassowary isoform X2 [Arctopsyche grandis]|uniref:apoptosis inhibitor cassowary isoform X2 n=1 Tax=Arctopsyche grandis TaxID=121162 RepID=UPI00406D6CE2
MAHLSTDNIEKLYKHYGVLAEAKDNISEHEKEYVEILEAVKGTDKEKRLASQFIGKFFKHFPNLSHQAIEAHLDLCEDDDISIRKQAIKDLPSLCKDSKEHTQRIADILAQLLQAYDTTELNTVHNSILTLMKLDPKGALSGLFSQIQQGTDNELVRERCIKFLSSKVKQLGKEYINKDAEDYIIAECKKVLEDVNAEEFDQVMELLGWTRLGRTAAGHREIVDLVAAQSLTDGEFSAGESEHIDRLVQCVGHALPYFSSQVNSTRFVSFFCEHVIPKISEIPESTEEGGDSKLELLKLLAELSLDCGTLEKSDENVETIYNCLIKYMPLPPATVGEETEEVPPILEFSHVECLLFTFHRLARQTPAFLTSDPARLKEFRLRLQYFARLTQGYIKKLKEATNGKTNEELKTDENKIKVVALKTTSNINTLIKDLFHTPPSYKNVIQLSFQTRSQKNDDVTSKNNKTSEVVGEKRHKPITFDQAETNRPPIEKRPRLEKGTNQKMYTPPSGKYSNRINVSLAGNPSYGGGNWRRGRNSRNFNRNTSRNGAPFRRNYY